MLPVDIHEKIETKEQVQHMIDNYVPSMMRPKVWPGFAGFDVVDQQFMKEHFFDFVGNTAEDEYIPSASVVIDMATWFRAASMDPPQEVMFVIFLVSDQSWACTYIAILSDVAKIILSTERGEHYAGSDSGATASLRMAIDICQSMFPETHKEILTEAYEGMKKLRSDQ